ncbi:hypothetical protein [Lentzea sp.]|uniref:hypothetical protein n=1 Tax=Lentzea sp. TaxID=56099 RepID=UPI002C9C1CC7|nr:hypothetical protein [Lentzea sp.]HUQ61710.1 hypothetical protein [Lentzea sp.]
MRKRLTALAAITAALLAPAAPALARQHEGPISPEVVALMATQDQLHEIAGRIGKGNGFGGFYVDAGGKTLHVHWKGKAPAQVNAVAAVARTRGLTVEVHNAKHSQAELKAEAARLVQTGSIRSVAAEHDGSGLAVTPKAGSGGFELAASRLVDWAPFKGGAYISNYKDAVPQGTCSSGFAVLTDTTDTTKLLTAAHCGDLDSTFANGYGHTVGWVEERSPWSDSGIISVADAQPRVWIGDSIESEILQPATNQYPLDVVGATGTLPGDWLCDSGAYSGTICEIQAVNTGVTACFPDFGCTADLVEAVHRGGYSAGGNGDSGGPVFSVRQPGDRLVARGTLTAISLNPSDLRQCSGVPERDGRRCSQRILFPDITSQMAAHGVRIKTAS